MIGSAGIAAAIAHVAFWLLLARAWVERGTRTAAIFLALWVTAAIGLPRIEASLFFPSYVAVLDIALVFVVFKGDVQVFR